MEYYVVRIYRRSESPAAEPVGIVERVDARQRIPFRGFSELVGILRVCPSVKTSGERKRIRVAKRRRD